MTTFGVFSWVNAFAFIIAGFTMLLTDYHIGINEKPRYGFRHFCTLWCLIFAIVSFGSALVSAIPEISEKGVAAMRQLVTLGATFFFILIAVRLFEGLIIAQPLKKTVKTLIGAALLVAFDLFVTISAT